MIRLTLFFLVLSLAAVSDIRKRMIPDWMPLLIAGVSLLPPEPVYLTASVPVLIWEIGPEDERNLDIYEGHPRLYGKVNLEVQMENGSESIMAYTMNEGHEIGIPSVHYLETITTGYLEAGFDVNRLLESVSHCKELAEREPVCEGMEENPWNQQLLQ